VFVQSHLDGGTQFDILERLEDMAGFVARVVRAENL
jgi:hypothetical protein